GDAVRRDPRRLRRGVRQAGETAGREGQGFAGRPRRGSASGTGGGVREISEGPRGRDRTGAAIRGYTASSPFTAPLPKIAGVLPDQGRVHGDEEGQTRAQPLLSGRAFGGVRSGGKYGR